MAPIKFEEHIKEKLDKREIQPSAESWDKLNSRLNASEKESGRKWWISAAAAVAVLLVASVLFVNQQEQPANPIVVSPLEENVQENSENIDFEPPVQVALEESNEGKDEEIIRSEINKSKSQKLKEQVVENQNHEKELTPVEVSENSKPERNFIEPVEIRKTAIAKTETNELYNRVEEVLAKMSQGEKSPEDYTEAEVDALLAQAASEISNSQEFHKEGSISATALLADVEYEVDQSFRKEVFDFLKEEFLKARTAVATRND